MRSSNTASGSSACWFMKSVGFQSLPEPHFMRWRPAVTYRRRPTSNFSHSWSRVTVPGSSALPNASVSPSATVTS